MRYRNLGRSGLSVSEVGLGGEHLEGKPYAQVEATVHAALDAGINVLDIFMSNPEVRSDLGRALKGRRGDIIIQGQIGSGWIGGQYARTRDIDQCHAFYEDLLERLNTDYMDVAMVHYVDTEEDLRLSRERGLFDYAQALKRSGAARAVGVSSHDPLIARRIVESGEVDVLMFSINPAYDVAPADTDLDHLFMADTYSRQEAFSLDPDREALYRACETRGVGITSMKTLAAGALLKAESSPFGVAMSVAQLIHYALTRPAVASVLLGAKTPEEIAEAVAYETASDAERDYAAALKAAPKFSMRGKCMYCNHCLPCPKHIDIAAVNRFLDLAEQSERVPASVREHYLSLTRKAGDCIECRRCEPNCPFEVSIAERMRRARAVFGA
ncbi:MAG: aldo/keto reductase [Christensenellaceae bacterium]|nr:aldo/keto reductase [Christensenellaceae bacterium]